MFILSLPSYTLFSVGPISVMFDPGLHHDSTVLPTDEDVLGHGVDHHTGKGVE